MKGRWDVVALVVGAFGLLIAVLAVSGASPLATVQTLFRGSLGSPGAISGTLRETTPLLIAGLAVFVALRAGLFNIGVDGQLVVGALACACVALRFPGPIGLVLGTMAGSIAGALWAWPAAWIKAVRGGHEVISTIMLNNIAGLLTTALVAGPLKDAKEQSPTTATLGASDRMPWLIDQAPFQVNLAILFGVVGTVAMAWWLKRTVSGYELQAVGGNPVAASFAGIEAKRVTMRTMILSGAIAGFAGCMQVLAYEGRFYAGFSPGYGFDALGVALLAGSNALGVLPSSLLFGILAKGGTAIQIMGVPKGITTVVLGLVILVAAVLRYRKQGEPAR
ncbi:MAG: ABC transporter permease [Fimbriimonas sp.]